MEGKVPTTPVTRGALLRRLAAPRGPLLAPGVHHAARTCATIVVLMGPVVEWRYCSGKLVTKLLFSTPHKCPVRTYRGARTSGRRTKYTETSLGTLQGSKQKF